MAIVKEFQRGNYSMERLSRRYLVSAPWHQRQSKRRSFSPSCCPTLYTSSSLANFHDLVFHNIAINGRFDKSLKFKFKDYGTICKCHLGLWEFINKKHGVISFGIAFNKFNVNIYFHVTSIKFSYTCAFLLARALFSPVFILLCLTSLIL